MRVSYIYTVSQKKFSIFKLSATLQILTDFQNFCTAGNRMKFATEPIRHYPPHLRYVATLPWEIKNSNSPNIQQMLKKMQTTCIFIASNFVIHPEILIFSVFIIGSCSPHWLQIKFSMSLFFYLFHSAINL